MTEYMLAQPYHGFALLRDRNRWDEIRTNPKLFSQVVRPATNTCNYCGEKCKKHRFTVLDVTYPQNATRMYCTPGCWNAQEGEHFKPRARWEYVRSWYMEAKNAGKLSHPEYRSRKRYWLQNSGETE